MFVSNPNAKDSFFSLSCIWLRTISTQAQHHKRSPFFVVLKSPSVTEASLIDLLNLLR